MAEDKESEQSQQRRELLNELLEGVIEVANKSGKLSEEAIRDAVNKAFSQAGVSGTDIPIEIVHLRRVLGEESDRGCALSATAYVETQLGLLIQSVLLEDKNMIKELFTGTGPLATFSSRINMAYLLGLIGRKAMNDLHNIRKIRNDFAHNPKNIKFTDEPIASRCAMLYHDVWQEKLPPRKKFIRVILGVLGAIHLAMKKTTRPPASDDVDIHSTEFQEKSKRVREEIEKQKARLKGSAKNPAN